MTRKLSGVLLALACLAGLVAVSAASPGGAGTLCPGSWYQSTACGDAAGMQAWACPDHPGVRLAEAGPCPIDGADLVEQACPCEACAPGADCACVAGLKEGTGTIRGVLDSKKLRSAPALVFLEGLPPRDYAQAPSMPVMDQQGSKFLPYLLPVLQGSPVLFKNNDPVMHNVFSPDNEAYDLGDWGQGGFKVHVFETPGVYTQLCRLHPEMLAYVVVLENPWWAVVEEGSDGSFELRNVPAGTWRLKAWHERFRGKALDAADEVTVTAGGTAEVRLER